ncbi:MAG: hypothetical protein HC799_14755 [Limnothrix sp. RL_2_0]|nr:hypothetical protein [Limnothrix sp. RL_2_0]
MIVILSVTAYLEQLAKFYPGALKWESGKIIVEGSSVNPVGASAVSTDLRGSMALVLAGILSQGESQIDKVHMALRGYDQLKEKLSALGIETSIF